MISQEIVKYCENGLLQKISELYTLQNFEMTLVEAHIGGRNVVYIAKKGNNKFILRISSIEDKKEIAYLAETEFVHYLAKNGASVADVICSKNDKQVEEIIFEDKVFCVSAFTFAKGILISDNNYQYRENAPLSEYFYNTGKTLGKIHALSKEYKGTRKYLDYFEHYNMEYINGLISNQYVDLKQAIEERLIAFHKLPKNNDIYGLVHFDFSDGNYHIDYETGKITVFDFENCCTCWYMFDLANLWTHGVGWIAWEQDTKKRKEFMEEYFRMIIQGYRTETDLPEDMLQKLPLFIDMVLIEGIIDDFECCKRAGETLDYEDIEDGASALIEHKEYAGFFEG